MGDRPSRPIARSRHTTATASSARPGIFSFELTIPGGVLPAAGVTIVGVHPTHRRRGILRRMMRLQLDAIHERGEPLAILWASEGSIYQRFGYGLGSMRTGINLDARPKRLPPAAHPGGHDPLPRDRRGEARACRRSTTRCARCGPASTRARRRSGTPRSSPTPSTGGAARVRPSTSSTRSPAPPTATPATGSATTGTAPDRSRRSWSSS